MSLFFLYMFILILFLLGKFLVDEHAEQAHRWLEATAHLPKNRRAHRRLALRYRAFWQPWSRARMPWPLHLAMPVLARTRSRGVGGRGSSQQPPEAQRVAQMEVAGAQNLQAAACQRREADPVGGRRRREAG